LWRSDLDETAVRIAAVDRKDPSAPSVLWDEDTGSTFEVRLCKSLDDAIYSARGATISRRALRAQRALAIAAE
jgi:hypothetical protein